MKFVVSSTSGGHKEQPCEEAKRGSIERENKIYSATADVWFVEINTLEELIKFYEEYGDIIIKDCLWNKSYTEIEIYDDYRE